MLHGNVDYYLILAIIHLFSCFSHFLCERPRLCLSICLRFALVPVPTLKHYEPGLP